ncbi:MAG: SH3 domain-containing protein [Hyphomicrobiales bacterium]|nr:SH3 domain-containing protein [Hyphomicrobiales bacterium]
MNTRSILRGLTMGLALLTLPSAALAADGFARSSGTLRAGAGSDYPAVMRVSAGTELDVIGCLRRYTWCDVAVDGERGWFPGRRIGFLRDGRRVYLSDGGAALGLAILSFGMADYWGSHYAERPWYNERRWWRRHGPMPPHLANPPRIGRPGQMPPRYGNTPPRVGGPEPMPPNVGSPVPRTMRIDAVKPGEPVVKSQDRIVEPPKVRAPQGVMRSDPPRNVGRTDRLQRPQMQQRQAPQGDGQLPMPPAGR